jgi:predicted RNA-binding Zn ribbon-like protein
VATFDLIGGHPALDLVNTVDWRRDPGRRRELLVTFDDLLAWARMADVVSVSDARAMRTSAHRDPRHAERTLRRARRLREVLARLASAAAAGRTPDARDMRVLNAFLRAAYRQRSLEARGAGFAWRWDAGSGDRLDALLWPIVVSAADLLTSASRQDVRECAGDGCGWLFLDTSRNRRRRWCAMEGCGNRAKARRHYERARDALATPNPRT